MITKPRAFRFTDDDRAIMAWLGKAWGPIQPMGRTAVIREALKRCKAAEERKQRSKGKSTQEETE